jgi:hypothetical protein
MVRAAKTSTPAPAVAQSAPSTTPAAAAAAKPAAKKAVKAAEAPVASAAAPATVSTDAVVADVSSLPVKMTEFNAKLQQLVSLFSTVKNDFKTLEKAVAREMKNV